MALSRRTGQRFQGSIWPGFVDAMTGLLLVLMFVLTIFMMVQFVLRETITGQKTKLDALGGEVAALAQALGLAQAEVEGLEGELGALNATLDEARANQRRQAALISSLTQERDRQAAQLTAAGERIAGFEEQVATLLAEKSSALENVAVLEAEKADLLTAQEAANAALAQARSEIDSQAEAARLAAAKREAMEALLADLRSRNADQAEQTAQLTTQLEELREELSSEEQARLAEAEAAALLRERLEGAGAELTALSLELEKQRQEAENTLTLLAAAQAAGDDLSGRLEEALVSLAAAQAREQDQHTALASLEERLTAALAQLELADGAQSQAQELAEEVARLRAQVAPLGELETANASLEERLAQALAERLSAEQTARQSEADLAAAIAAKLAAEEAAQQQQSEAERQRLLLSVASTELDEEKARSQAAERETALLNTQLSALNERLGSLQALLDDARERDAASQVRLESLGSDLNAALAQKAAEERKRRMLEEAERKRLESEAQNLEKYRSEFFGRLRDILGTQEGVRIVGDRFVFSSEVLFAPGRASLSADGRQQIARIAELLNRVIGDIPEGIDWVLRVDGHTDNLPLSGQGEFRDNWELSQARALSVVRFMSEELGMPPGRLSANGFGQYQPINPANTEAARAQNRRIELKFTEK